MLLKYKTVFYITKYFIAFVWLANGMFCKILNFVPRHEQIVKTIMQIQNARTITFIIGCLEVLMVLWVLSNIKSKWSAIVQITIVLTMNVIEQILTPNLLLWGKLNFVFAVAFSVLIYIQEFYIKPKCQC